jgi:four helix bundle protein
MRSFEDLQVYQIAEKLANKIWFIVSKWDYFTKETMGKQLVRSVDSIGANIAEGNGRYNHKDKERFIKIARGSLYETRHWLRLAFARNLLVKEDIDEIKPLVKELSPKLNAYLNSIKKTTEYIAILKLVRYMINFCSSTD